MEWLTDTQYAQLTATHVRTVQRRCQSGDIPAVKQGRFWRIPAEAVPASPRVVASDLNGRLNAPLDHPGEAIRLVTRWLRSVEEELRDGAAGTPQVLDGLSEIERRARAARTAARR